MSQKKGDGGCAKQNQDQDILELLQQNFPGRDAFRRLNFICAVLQSALGGFSLTQSTGLAFKFGKGLFGCLGMPDFI